MKALLVVLFLSFVASGFGKSLQKKHTWPWDECRQLDQDCDGLPACCGETVCYWEDGYSRWHDGVCVECVDRGLRCQRDNQCCDPLVCQKSNPLHVDGTCDVRLENGAECHEDDNCASDHCNKSWYEVYGYCDEAGDDSSSRKRGYGTKKSYRRKFHI